MDAATLKTEIMDILAEGLTAEAIADAIVAAVFPDSVAPPAPSEPLAEDDPAVTGVPRDETHDSVDPATGTLTAEASAKRTADAQALADAQARLAEDQAKVTADEAEVAADQATLDADPPVGDDTVTG